MIYEDMPHKVIECYTNDLVAKSKERLDHL